MKVLNKEQPIAQVLQFSKNEKYIFNALRSGLFTPLLIGKKTGIPRPTVYVTLESLKARGLVERRKESGKHYWKICDMQSLEEKVYEAKKFLFDFGDGRAELHSYGDGVMITHRGKDAIKKLLHHMFKEHHEERMYGLQGTLSTKAWSTILSVDDLNDLNKSIKKNHIIIHAVLEKDWIKNAFTEFGEQWEQDFEGRTTSVHEIDSKYMKHATEVWLFKKSVYLIAPYEQLIIEIRNSDMVIMFKSFFEIIKDTHRAVDVNRILRDLS